MKKEFIEAESEKLRQRQRILFRTFGMNVILGVIAWALTMVPGILYFGVWMTGFSAMLMYYSAISAIALWQILNVAFFFAPAIATWWERKMMK